MGHFIEPIIKAIHDLLDSNLPAALDAIDATYDDGIVLQDVVAIYQGRMFVFDNFPSIVIWPDASPGGEYTSQTFFNNHRIVVWIVVSGNTPVDTKRRVWRYLRAITEVLRADTTLGGAVDICHFRGHTYNSPWTSEQENSYIEDGGVVLEIRHEEDL